MAEPTDPGTLVAFVGGPEGLWRIDGILAHKGESLPPAARLAVLDGDDAEKANGRWVLRAMVGTERDADDAPPVRPPPLGRPEARCAVLVAVRKSAEWWATPHDERPAVLEELSPAIARRVHTSNQTGEPFDYLAWFEYPPGDQGAFDELVARLRATDEWAFVEREVHIRVTR